MPSVDQNETLSRVSGDKTKPIMWLSGGTSPKHSSPRFTGGHGKKNVRGAREAVSASFFFRHWPGGTFLPSLKQSETPRRVLGDKTNCSPHPPVGTPARVFLEGMIRKNAKSVPDRVKALFFFRLPLDKALFPSINETRIFAEVFGSKTSLV